MEERRKARRSGYLIEKVAIAAALMFAVAYIAQVYGTAALRHHYEHSSLAADR